MFTDEDDDSFRPIGEAAELCGVNAMEFRRVAKSMGIKRRFALSGIDFYSMGAIDDVENQIREEREQGK